MYQTLVHVNPSLFLQEHDSMDNRMQHSLIQLMQCRSMVAVFEEQDFLPLCVQWGFSRSFSVSYSTSNNLQACCIYTNLQTSSSISSLAASSTDEKLGFKSKAQSGEL